jgi:hypothetical protein
MRIRTLLLYLIGDRKAILELAADRRALWVGLLFVLSAGFAREYDGEDLLHEPWHLLIPLGASLAASFGLYLIACLKFDWKSDQNPPFLKGYRSFLTLFWMTAPLAWAYAIPYERFLSAYDAVVANFITLGVVALWRVVLMIRVLHVLMGFRPLPAIFIVMTFADIAAIATVFAIPAPVFSLMGGIRMSESQQLVQAVTLNISCSGILTAPIWIIGGIISLFGKRLVWAKLDTTNEQAGTRSGQLWWVAAVAIVIWAPLLAVTQGEQMHRGRVERDLTQGRIAEGLAYMSAHKRSDFPPHWDPPPRVDTSDLRPEMIDVLEALADQPHAEWVRQTFFEKFAARLGEFESLTHEVRGENLARVARVIKKLPAAATLLSSRETTQIEETLKSNTSLTPAERANLQLILAAVRGEKSE